jgi:hypothetical protein
MNLPEVMRHEGHHEASRKPEAESNAFAQAETTL